MSLVLSSAQPSVKPQSAVSAGGRGTLLSQAECAAFLAAPLIIGDLRVPNRVFSAPMSGVSDLPYQNLALVGGAGLVFTEMAASHLLAAEEGGAGAARAETQRRLAAGAGQRAAQLFGSAPEAMAAAAKSAEAQGAVLIDINMGCPAKKLVQKHDKSGAAAACGAALMRDEGLALAIIKAVIRAVSVPVSVKMRLGWDGDSVNAPHLAAKAVQAGAAMITVHARTRAQFYSGTADWAAVKAVRAAMDAAAPDKALIINGDIGDMSSAAAALSASGADGVMIGRAACGQPWLAGLMAGHQPINTPLAGAVEHRRNIGIYILAHYRAMLHYYGEARGLRHARKHLDWYLQKQAAGFYSAAERVELMAARAPHQAEAKFMEIFARLP